MTRIAQVLAAACYVAVWLAVLPFALAVWAVRGGAAWMSPRPDRGDAEEEDRYA